MRVLSLHVVHRKALPGGYAVLRLGGEPIEAEPGQFVMLRGDWGFSPFLPRPFSLALVEGNELTLLVKSVGEGSRRLAAVQRGDTLTLHGPLGTAFRKPERGERLLLVGGGVGIAPLLFLARVAKPSIGGGLAAIYGGRTRRDLPMAAELAAAAENVTFVTEDGSAGEKGLASDAMRALLARPGFDRVVACGPWPMMAAAARLAAEKKVPCEVSLEAMMACGYGICLGCAVPTVGGGYLYACSDGPVVDAGRVVWEAGDLEPVASAKPLPERRRAGSRRARRPEGAS